MNKQEENLQTTFFGFCVLSACLSVEDLRFAFCLFQILEYLHLHGEKSRGGESRLDRKLVCFICASHK